VSTTPSTRLRRGLWILIAAALLLMGVEFARRQVPASPPAPAVRAPQIESSGDQAIEDAIAAHRSGEWVEAGGTVERVLADDRSGLRHQRFIVRLEDGHTLLFAHNIDLAPRVPVEPGSRIRFRGIYEWSARGGTVHWTHHDPDRAGAGGWIDLEGRRYR
jgi:hypothetical protein